MVGGTVIETINVPATDTKSARVWINCEEDKSGDQCAIYVEDTAAARCVQPKDSVWWQSEHAMWTPRSCAFRDYKLKRIGFSGVKRPVVKGDNIFVVGVESVPTGKSLGTG